MAKEYFLIIFTVAGDREYKETDIVNFVKSL